MIKALIFDFDGTIIDTETAWYNVFKDAYAQYGVELSLATYAKCLGTNLQTFNPYTYLVTHHHIQLDVEAFQTSIQQRPCTMDGNGNAKTWYFNIATAGKGSGFEDWTC